MSIKDELLQEIDRVEKKLANLEISRIQTTTSITTHKRTLNKLKQDLAKVDAGENLKLKFTDHAIIRYMQRHMEIDLLGLQNTIEEELKNAHIGIAKVNIPYGKGYFVIENKTVVTFIIDTKDKR